MIKNYILSLVVIILLALIFWPMVMDNGNEETLFSFEIDQTQEYVDGEVLFDNVSFGFTEGGRISVPLLNETPSEIIFRANYGGTVVEFFYDFPSDYFEWGEIPFRVSGEDLDYHAQLKLTKDN